MADPAIGGAILGEDCLFVDLMYWLLHSEPISVSAYSLSCDAAVTLADGVRAIRHLQMLGLARTKEPRPINIEPILGG